MRVPLQTQPTILAPGLPHANATGFRISEHVSGSHARLLRAPQATPRASRRNVPELRLAALRSQAFLDARNEHRTRAARARPGARSRRSSLGPCSHEPIGAALVRRQSPQVVRAKHTS